MTKASKLGIICFCLSTLFTWGCSGNKSAKTSVITDFPETAQLVGERVNLSYAEYLGNMFECAGDYYVFNAIRSPYCFQIYDKNFNLVDTIVTKGPGPEELSGGALYLGQWQGDKNNPDILAYCSAQRKLVALNINPYGNLKTTVNFPMLDNLTPKYAYQVSDTLFIGLNLDVVAGANLFSYNPTNNNLQNAEPPFTFKEGLGMFSATQQSIALNQSSKLIACAYLSFPWITVYDYNFNLIGKIAVGQEVDTDTYSEGDRYPELVHISWHNDRIVVLYSPDDDSDSKILVISSDGSPIASYGVGKAIWYVIDSQTNRLLTANYDPEEDEMYLMAFDLPKELAN